MKKTVKPLEIVAVVVLVAFSMLSCEDNPGYTEITHYGNNALSINGEQVYTRNYSATKLSEMYDKFSGNYEISVLVEGGKEVSTGAIQNGILDFTVAGLLESEELDWDDLKIFFKIVEEGEGWENVTIDKPGIRGSLIELKTKTGNKVLMREGMSGTDTSLSTEWVFFIYVDGDCKITGDYWVDEVVDYSFYPFELNLYEGWNTICFTQTFTAFGRSAFYMAVKNPDLKWVLVP